MQKTTALDIQGLAEEESHIKNAIELDMPVLLIGETGTGKTSLIKKLARDMKNEVVRINLNGQTSTDEFVGKYVLRNKEMVWQDGILTDCLQTGKWLLVDEINAALPEILFVLHSLLDDERAIMLNEKDGSVIKAHKDFRFFATMNPTNEYAGTKELNKALLSRFGTVLNVDFPDYSTEVEVIVKRTAVPASVARKIITFARQTRDLKKKDEVFNCCSTRDAIHIATLFEKQPDKEKDLTTAMMLAFGNKVSKDELTTFKDNGIKIQNLEDTESFFTRKELEKEFQRGQKEHAAIMQGSLKLLQKWESKFTEEEKKELDTAVTEVKAASEVVMMSAGTVQIMTDEVPF